MTKGSAPSFCETLTHGIDFELERIENVMSDLTLQSLQMTVSHQVGALCKRQANFGQFKQDCSSLLTKTGLTLLATKEKDSDDICEKAMLHSEDCDEMGEVVFYAYLKT